MALKLSPAIRDFGLMQALHSRNMSVSDYRRVKAARETLIHDGTAKRMVAGMGAALLAGNGMQASEAYPILLKVASAEHWSAELDYLAGGVLDGIHAFEKKAVDMGQIGDAVSTAAKTSPSVWHTLLMASALLGSSSGALSWHYNRDASEDEINNAEMQTQIRQYRGMAEDVNSAVRARKANLLAAPKRNIV